LPVVSASSASEHPVTPRFGISWQPDRDDLFYATAASGYRVGGINADVGSLCGPDLTSIGLTGTPPSSRSDSLWSYELGAKNTALNHALQINTSLFTIDWKNIQQSVYLPTCGLQYSANLGRVRSHGGDMEITYHRGPLQLYLGAAYTDARYVGTVCATPVINCTAPGSAFLPIVSEGDRLPGAPWSFVASAEHAFAIGNALKPYLRVDYQYSTTQTAHLPVQNPANGLSDATVPGLPVVKNLGLRAGVRFGGFDGLAAPLHFSHQHCALDRREAEVGHAPRVGALGEPSPGFLLEEEGGELVPHHLEDQADVLANELVVSRHLVAQGSERAAARHLVALLQLEVGREPPLEIAPGADLVVDRGSARLDRLEIGLQDFVYQAFLVPEVVIELPLSGP